MKLSDIPTKFNIPFGQSAGAGFTRVIPEASQIGIQAGAASLTDGFVPDNFIPVGSGGVPPFGEDMNGILRQITQWSRWQNAGATVVFDGTFAAAIGGYPKGTILASAAVNGLFYSSAIDDNTTDPDADSSNWFTFSQVGATRVITASGVFAWDLGARLIGLNRTTSLATSSSSIPTNMAIGQQCTIDDLAGNFNSWPVTISAPSGCTINGLAGWVLNEDYGSGTFTRYSSTLFKVNLT